MSCSYDVAGDYDTSRRCGRDTTWIVHCVSGDQIQRCDEHAGQCLLRKNVVKIVPLEQEPSSKHG